MRVAIVAESFLPHMNGVTGSILHILRHLERRGHEAFVLAPQAQGMPSEVHGARIEAVPSMALPGYRDVRVGATSVKRVALSLARFRPDVVHLASPFVLGWRGAVAAEKLNVASVAAYQTDVAGYSERYGLPATTSVAQRHVARLHRKATLTLSPSRACDEDLATWGVDRVQRWGRGVDAERFHPTRRSERWRRSEPGEVIIGYVGRLAAEKQIGDLRVLSDIPHSRLVIVGDGPERAQLERMLPEAVFLGYLAGDALAEAMASFDIFVHPGESDTFGQTLQEAHASGVPVVATGRGGPLDLVRMGIDGWLYQPGNLDDLEMRVRDLAGDAAKRRAFGRAGREAVEGRSWESVCDHLLDHFDTAQKLQRVDRALRTPRLRRPELHPPREAARWRRYVALGDSLTEGLCDPGPDGALRGWADRLAHLLSAQGGVHFANLAVRSRRVHHMCEEQLPQALALKPELVSILIGANDLVQPKVDISALAAQVDSAVGALRAAGSEVLLVTPFLPDRRLARLFDRRFAAFASALADIAERHSAMLVDTDLHPSLAARTNWGDDYVHLSSNGHRFLAYRAGEVLGVPHADTLAALDEVFHAQPVTPARAWWRQHALPWVWRRMRGRTAGDGRFAKHDGYIWVGRSNMPRVPVQ